MCINIEIILPTIETFLLLYSLRCGSTVILLWTIIRALFCVVFFTMAILELLVHENTPFGAWLLRSNYQVPGTLSIPLFYCYIILVICDAVLVTFTMFLGYGIYFESSNLLKYYLVCRFLAWVVEILVVSILCIIHKFLIGYYLSILLFVVLEFYSFVVVYSYFVTIYELEGDSECKNETSCAGQELQEQTSFCNEC